MARVDGEHCGLATERLAVARRSAEHLRPVSRQVLEVESKLASLSPDAIASETAAWPVVTNAGFCAAYLSM